MLMMMMTTLMMMMMMNATALQYLMPEHASYSTTHSGACHVLSPVMLL
jgi:hypothetical protein